MGRRHVVRDLSDEQFTFVVEAIINGFTDREISVAFEKQFEAPLAKSSLHRWRDAAGNELAERYRLARYQARQLLVNLKEEDANKYQTVIDNIEDRLLTATREVIAQDPIKLLVIRQEEEKRRLKERELALKERALALQERQAQAARVDQDALPGQILKHLLAFIGEDAAGLAWFKKNAKGLEAFLSEQYGAES